MFVLSELSIILSLGFPHLLQINSGHPDFIGVSHSSTGNVAKCDSENGFVVIVHTVLLFLPSL